MDDVETRDWAARELGAQAGLVRVERIVLPTLQTLRLFKPGDADIQAASARLGFELPRAASRLTADLPSAARLGPGEWLIRQGSAADISARLEGVLHHVSEVGAGRVGWRIAGPAAPDLIAAGCSIDPHPRVFPPGACVRTLLAQVGVILSRPHAGEAFELIAARPAQHHLTAWLNDAVLGFLP